MRTPSPICSLRGLLVGFGVRAFFALVLSLPALSAFAQATTPVPTVWQRAGVTYEEPLLLCMAAIADNAVQPFTRFELRGATTGRALDCYRMNSGGTADFIYAAGAEACPVGATNTGTQCLMTNPCASQAGDKKNKNFTLGWGRSNNPDANDLAITNPSPIDTGDYCDGACMWQIDSVVSCARSQVPAANGLHRISCTYGTSNTGSVCPTGAAGPANADPVAPSPPCPGLLGQVNGKAVCFGSPTTPLPSAPKPGGLPPESYGNPAAGDIPSTGPGSGSGPSATPPVGNGGNDGGGSNAAIPGGGSEGNGQGNGTPQGTNADGSGSSGSGGSGSGVSGSGDPIEFPDTCGLPGKPSCKIDESGTPNGDGTFTSSGDAVTASRQSAIDGINEAGSSAGKSAGWSFTFAFPSGCSVIPLAGFEPYLTGIDVCQWQGITHDLMSMVWLAVTAFCCIGMVGRAVGGGA